MILLNKPVGGPAIPYQDNRNGGQCRLAAATLRFTNRYQQNQLEYDNGERTFSFDSSLYGHENIKTALMQNVQHNKCCFCQKDISDDFSVEHFRPKDGYSQEIGEAPNKPGYYWLAYVWKNLFYSCTKCNQHKGTKFPLDNPDDRSLNHLADPNCDEEVVTLIHPSDDDPETFITFVGVEIVPLNDDVEKKRRAKTTIDTCKLDRKGLFELRWSHYEKILAFRESCEIAIGTPREEEAREKYNRILNNYAQPGQEYSLMVKSNLDNLSMN